MGKATGFIEFTRSLPLARTPATRVRDWQEFHEHLPASVLREQGARCMDCGVPFCHTGEVLQGMATGCPLHNLIPEWNDAVYRGDWRDALTRLHLTNNFPEFTGRVCPAPCEGSCVLGLNADPVSIKEIEVAIADKGWAEGWITPAPPTLRTGKKVAVIGSGPAGLACAAELNRAGHSVTVFERADRIGGLLLYGIPNMKLDKELVARRVNLLEAEGVAFRTGVEVGRDVSAEELRRDYDAIVLCGGATQARDLPVAGRNLRGVHLAMEFLTANTKSLLDSQHTDGQFIDAQGLDVIVIGGGDTGTDCVGTSLRHGCRSLTQFEIMPQPPTARAADNPWPQYPRIFRTDYGQEEAIALHGADPRRYAVLTKRFTDDGAGAVGGVETVEVAWTRGAEGRMTWQEIAGTEKFWPAQCVLLALGFVGPEKGGLLEQLGVKLDGRGNVAINNDFMTSVQGVFAAGDMSRGQSLVVWAIAGGRRAAAGVSEYLLNESAQVERRRG